MFKEVAKAKASMEDFVASAANDVKAAREASAVSGEAAVEVQLQLQLQVHCTAAALGGKS